MKRVEHCYGIRIRRRVALGDDAPDHLGLRHLPFRGQATDARHGHVVEGKGGSVDARFISGSPAIVDIAPSILQHLRITVLAAVAKEKEGALGLTRRPAQCLGQRSGCDAQRMTSVHSGRDVGDRLPSTMGR